MKNLIKDVKDMHNKIFQTLRKEMEEISQNLKTFSIHGLVGLML